MAPQRKLVTLRAVTSVRRMKGAHYKKYDVVTVGGGWTVVVFHGAYHLGQRVFYFEIDSFIPTATGLFTWEENRYMQEFQGQKGYHVCSHMIDKQLSQGMVQPLDALPELKRLLDQLETDHGAAKAAQMARNMSFEEALGVRKWEVPFEVQGQVLGGVPQFFPRPGCERVQNNGAVFTHKYLDTVFQVTEKLDGVSMTVYCVAAGSKWSKSLPALPVGSDAQHHCGGARVGVASAAEDFDARGDNVYWQAARRVGLLEKLQRIGPHNVAVQGELVGPSIKKNSLGFAEDAAHEFVVFQIFDIVKQELLDAAEVVDICERLELPHVPVIGYMKLREFATSLEEILQKAEGMGYYGQTREGLVFKGMVQNDGFAFKVISNQWLLERGE